VTNRNIIGERTIILDCDVVEADGGTRTAAITGAYVALGQAFQRLIGQRQIGRIPISDYVAAVSVGIVEGEPVVDLCYIEDMQAEVDMNVVMTGNGEFIEVQGTAEKKTFTINQMHTMLDLASKSIMQLIDMQRELLKLKFNE
jgi:ribonuclease PH